MNSLETSLYFFGLIMFELTLLFIGISTIIGLVLVYISDEKLKRWLSNKGAFGNVLGALMGGLTPFCACSTIPMTVGMLKNKTPPNSSLGCNSLKSRGTGRFLAST